MQKVRDFLAKNKVDVSWRSILNVDSMSALHRASLYGHLELVSLLLEDPLIDVNQLNEHGKSPLHLACNANNTDVLRRLLDDERVDVNLPDSLMWTPLWWASYSGSIEVIIWLILSRREVDYGQKCRLAPEEPDISPMEIAQLIDNNAIVELLGKFIANPVGVREDLHYYEERGNITLPA